MPDLKEDFDGLVTKTGLSGEVDRRTFLKTTLVPDLPQRSCR